MKSQLSANSTDISIERRRALLRRALMTPNADPRLSRALAKVLTPLHLQRAAHNGIYIGYSREDGTRALEIHLTLRANGFISRFDELENDLSAWQAESNALLKKCQLMVLLISHHLLADRGALRQYGDMLALGKIVLPILLEPCDTHDLRLELPPIRWYENGSVAIQTLLETLRPQEDVISQALR
jgi:hypothetical protein